MGWRELCCKTECKTAATAALTDDSRRKGREGADLDTQANPTATGPNWRSKRAQKDTELNS